MQQHTQSHFNQTQTEEATGASLPQFGKDEFDAYLECRILTHGFLRLLRVFVTVLSVLPIEWLL